MLTFDQTFEDGDDVQYVLKDNSYHCGVGTVKFSNNEFAGIIVNSKIFYAPHKIYAMHHHSRDFDLGRYLKKIELPIKAQEYIFDEYKNVDTSKLQLMDFESDYIHHTPFQRVLFEQSYWDKSHLEHVNWFAPSACYYPKGWYNLGGERSEESDTIGEQVDWQWQAWRNALLQNMWLDTIKVEKVTYQVLV